MRKAGQGLVRLGKCQGYEIPNQAVVQCLVLVLLPLSTPNLIHHLVTDRLSHSAVQRIATPPLSSSAKNGLGFDTTMDGLNQ